MTEQKYYTDEGKERPPTLHEIICCEADVGNCREAERIEALIRNYYKSKVPKKRELPAGLEHLSKYDEDRGYNSAVDDFHEEECL